jgi:hypothetical protein
MTGRYAERMKRLLTPSERRQLRKWSTPEKIQDHLDSLPVNFEVTGETYMSVRRILASRTAHCFEGALLAAAALAFHGEKPLLMDFQTTPEDEDHIIALFTRNGFWGAISKTNHATLRYRDPIYRTPRELAMSYFHEYHLESGNKTLRAFSTPFDLAKYSPERWLTAETELQWLADALDSCRHYPAVPNGDRRLLRATSQVERAMLALTEWPDPRKKKIL